MRQVWHITLPGIRANPLVNDVADIIDTYLYYLGLVEAKYSSSTAGGLLKSAVSLGFVFATNYVARRVDPESGLL